MKKASGVRFQVSANHSILNWQFQQSERFRPLKVYIKTNIEYKIYKVEGGGQIVFSSKFRDLPTEI